MHMHSICRKFAMISRFPGVVEDDLLVELSDFVVHAPKNLFASVRMSII